MTKEQIETICQKSGWTIDQDYGDFLGLSCRAKSMDEFYIEVEIDNFADSVKAQMIDTDKYVYDWLEEKKRIPELSGAETLVENAREFKEAFNRLLEEIDHAG